MVHFLISFFNLTTSDFKLPKSVFLAKSDVTTPVALFKTAFVALLDKSNSIFTHASKDFGFGKYSLIYTMFFVSIHLLNELLYLFHLTYNVSHFFFITFQS